MNVITQPTDAWTSIWTKPRKTVRYLLDTDPRYMVLFLAALTGVSQVLDRASFGSLGDTVPLSTILLAALLLGPVSGIVALYVGGALIAWTGRWIGGAASAEHIRTAIAWASVPIAASLLLWVVDLSVIGESMFTTSLVEGGAAGWMMISALGAVVLGIWSLVLLFKGVGEAQGFSAWKGLGNVLLAVLVIFVPIVLIGVVAAIVIPALA